MELKELTEKTLEIFQVDSTGELSIKMFDIEMKNDVEYYKKFKELVKDLSIDWLQKIFQYYQADRVEKKQDYTPKSLASLIARLADMENEAKNTIDMCAGSGSLTIQKWNLNHNQVFMLYELDENVIPYLIFNMAIRNISCVISRADVLKQEVYKTWRITKGEEFGIVKEVGNSECANF
ncbi:MAG: N-6 DNA methylase [Anaerostipes sp.]|nr:N-6 DNA methylase [Anaerostipes sp.]